MSMNHDAEFTIASIAEESFDGAPARQCSACNHSDRRSARPCFDRLIVVEIQIEIQPLLYGFIYILRLAIPETIGNNVDDRSIVRIEHEKLVEAPVDIPLAFLIEDIHAGRKITGLK